MGDLSVSVSFSLFFLLTKTCPHLQAPCLLCRASVVPKPRSALDVRDAGVIPFLLQVLDTYENLWPKPVFWMKGSEKMRAISLSSGTQTLSFHPPLNSFSLFASLLINVFAKTGELCSYLIITPVINNLPALTLVSKHSERNGYCQPLKFQSPTSSKSIVYSDPTTPACVIHLRNY